jgi:hypothetical protein
MKSPILYYFALADQRGDDSPETVLSAAKRFGRYHDSPASVSAEHAKELSFISARRTSRPPARAAIARYRDSNAAHLI